MKPLNLFLLLTFGLFIFGFGITGILVFSDSPDFLVILAQIIMAWTPTMAFVIIHRKIDPDKSLWKLITDRFAQPIMLIPVLASTLIPVVAVIIVWFGYSMIAGAEFSNLVTKLSIGSFILMFFDSLIRGPLGEELGWRGYLQNEYNKKFPLLKSSLIVGVIWGLWHFPLWFVSGFQGVNLLLYIAFFMVGLISFSVITGYIYEKGGNLIYPILLHQMLNFSGRLLEIDELTLLGGSSAVYLMFALIIGVISWNVKKELVSAER